MQIRRNYPLKKLTTMQVGGSAAFFVEVKNVDELKEEVFFARNNKLEIFILSGGSNVVISDKGFVGLVIKIKIKGFEVIKEDKKNIWLKIGAGEVWDEVVARVVRHGWWGIENLSWIPGRIGAGVVQNSGAYGQEIKDVLERVRILELKGGQIKELNNEECGFGYRQSIFNSTHRDKYVIIEVVLKLSKSGQPQIGYLDVKKYFEQRAIARPSLGQIREAIIYIRNNKLPDIAKVGNAGSFFKNLILNEAGYKLLLDNLEENFGQRQVQEARRLRQKFEIKKGVIKVPTAWLIDICGLKGTRVGYVKVYERQPLVLITQLGKAKAAEVMGLFKKIRQVVYNKTGMKLEPEPRLVGFSQQELEEYFRLE